MTFFQAIFLAFVQGLTEFLPVSSSGHLVIFQKIFGLNPPVLFDVILHSGSLVAILIFFRKEIKKISVTTLKNILIATLPTAIIGLLLQSRIDQIFNSLKLVGFSLLLTSVFLFSTRLVKTNQKTNQLKTFDALIIGFFQAIALLPGVSRSGATITAGLWRTKSQKEAFRFSFLLVIPAILGALTLQLIELEGLPEFSLSQGILSFLIAGGVSLISLKLLEKILVKTRFWLFGFYTLTLGIILFLLS